jgi:1,4-alpha-glucan branching enzyme
MVGIQGCNATFRFLRPRAHRVCLVGEFNGWDINNLPMTRSADGVWTATLRLDPGEYRFRYWADGHWFVDYAAFGLVHGPFGLEGVVRIVGAGGSPAPAPCPDEIVAA